MEVYIALTVLFVLLAGTEAAAEELTCYTFCGGDYRGTINQTVTGITCQAWSAQRPHGHFHTRKHYPDKGLDGNYCRNPNRSAMPWCYTTKRRPRWEYCHVPTCDFTPELACYTCEGRKYRGEINTTSSGKICQEWSAQKPRRHGLKPQNYPDKGLDQNYCRNPGGAARPWCYTTDGWKRREYCQVPRCDVSPELTCYTCDGRYYRGVTATTSSGKTCQEWSSRVPHRHRYKPQNYPDKGLVKNYCRNPGGEPKPDGAAKPWCYTTDERTRWDYCQVPRCGAAEMTEADKKNIVDKHNELRRGVKPTASNMLKMRWNEEAGANARKWADKCTMRHSNGADRVTSTDGCGENLYMSSTEKSWDTAIQFWYNEIKDWEYGKGRITAGAAVEHFTQVVWYRSNQVGCAKAHCPNAKYQYYYVCQYCPGGNYGLLRPFKLGLSCGDCPNDCDDKLCTNSCAYKDAVGHCAAMKQTFTCRHLGVVALCPASCKCDNGEVI